VAIEFDFNKKKEDEKQPQSAFGPTTIGAGQQSQQGQQKGTSSGRFTNIQNFLGANRAANLGGNIAGKIGQVTGQVQQEVGNKPNKLFLHLLVVESLLNKQFLIQPKLFLIKIN